MKYIILNDSVFVWNKGNRTLFYDSDSFDYVLIEKTTNALDTICNKLSSLENLSVIEYKEFVKDDKAKELLSILINRGLARYSDDKEDCAIPPILLLNGDLDYLSDLARKDFIGTKNLYFYIANFTFFVDKEDVFRDEREKLIAEIKRNNSSFKYVVLSEESGMLNISDESKITINDIMDAHIDKRKIFIHQKINVHYWGHLFAFPNGEIHPCPYRNPKSLLGWIGDPILPMVGKELVENNAWRKVRDFYPCNECVFQWLCPSPKLQDRGQSFKQLCEVFNSIC